MESIVKLAVADPTTLFREGLKRLLLDTKNFVVVGEATNDVETMDVVEEAKPDVLLLDLNIPKQEALPILLAIKEQKLPTKVLILSLLHDESQILKSATIGAHGYILKSTSFAALVEAIGEVARGAIWADRHAGFADLFARLARRGNTGIEITGERNPFEVLSKRELQILNLIARGATNEEIATSLSITPLTVKTHVTHIFSKLNVSNRTQAALLLMRARLRNGQDYAGDLLRGV